MISKTHIEVAELDLMTAIIACENATVADRIKKFSSLAEQLLKERDAYREVAIELSVDWSVENTGEPDRKGCEKEVDDDAQERLSQPSGEGTGEK